MAPNQVELRVGVRAQSKVLSAAVEQQRLQIKQAIALAISNGVEEKDIRTAYLSINPIHERASGDTFYAHRDIAITLKDPARFDALLTVLIQSGVNEVYDIEFKTTELRKYRDQARAQALTAAKEKAAAMASPDVSHEKRIGLSDSTKQRGGSPLSGSTAVRTGQDLDFTLKRAWMG